MSWLWQLCRTFSQFIFAKPPWCLFKIKLILFTVNFWWCKPWDAYLVDLMSDPTTVEHHPVVRVHLTLEQIQSFEQSIPIGRGPTFGDSPSQHFVFPISNSQPLPVPPSFKPSTLYLGLSFLLFCCQPSLFIFSPSSSPSSSFSSSPFSSLPTLQHISVLEIRLLNQAMFELWTN